MGLLLLAAAAAAAAAGPLLLLLLPGLRQRQHCSRQPAPPAPFASASQTPSGWALACRHRHRVARRPSSSPALGHQLVVVVVVRLAQASSTAPSSSDPNLGKSEWNWMVAAVCSCCCCCWCACRRQLRRHRQLIPTAPTDICIWLDRLACLLALPSCFSSCLSWACICRRQPSLARRLCRCSQVIPIPTDNQTVVVPLITSLLL